MLVRPVAALAALCILCAPLQAHEFWIEPAAYIVPNGAPVTATFRNGEAFSGSTLSWIPARSERFDYGVGRLDPVPARMGDDPAFAVDAASEGLLVVVHETGERILTYREWAKWVRFTRHKGLDVLDAHRDRGLPDEGFREVYRRSAKALIAVGHGAGQDVRAGLLTEIVAEANPYTDDMSEGLPVQVLLDGAPKAGAQVEVFEKGPDGVAVTIQIADAAGRTRVPVRPGHEYLLDSVAIQPVEPEAAGDPVWRTDWATLTFAVPGA